MNVIKCKNTVYKKGSERICDRFLAKIMKVELMKPGFQIHLKCPACGNYAIVTMGVSGNVNVVHVKEGEAEICKKNLKT